MVAYMMPDIKQFVAPLAGSVQLVKYAISWGAYYAMSISSCFPLPIPQNN